MTGVRPPPAPASAMSLFRTQPPRPEGDVLRVVALTELRPAVTRASSPCERRGSRAVLIPKVLVLRRTAHGLEARVTPRSQRAAFIQGRTRCPDPSAHPTRIPRDPLRASPALLAAGCGKSGDHADNSRVVLYTSVDQPVAEPIVREFEKRTGIKVDLQTDTEATKSSGPGRPAAGGAGQPAGGRLVGQRGLPHDQPGRERRPRGVRVAVHGRHPGAVQGPRPPLGGHGPAGAGDRLLDRRRRREIRGHAPSGALARRSPRRRRRG